jgi:O-antigen/teichoic acid export membrane protein
MRVGEEASGSALRRVAANSLWFAAAEAVRSGLSFVAILYLSRTLSVGGMGIVEFGFAVFGMTQIVSTGGVDVLTIRRAARSPRDIGRLAGTSLLLSESYFFAAFAVMAISFSVLRLPAEMRQAALLFALAAATVPSGMRFALVGRERARVLAIVVPLGQAAFLALCVLGVHGSEDVLRVPLFLTIAIGLRSIIQLSAVMRRHGRIRFRLNISRYRSWLAATLRPSLGSVARALMLTIDVLVLGALMPTEEVAKYGIAAKIPLFLSTLAFLVHTAMFPTVARAVSAGDSRRLAAIQGDTMKAVLGVALPGVLCLAPVAEPLVILLFTAKFRASVTLLSVLLWRFPLLALSGVFRLVVWAKDPQLDAHVALVALGASAMGIVFLVTATGTIGATYGILIGDVVALIFYAWRALPSLGRVDLDDYGWLTRLVLGLGMVAGIGWVFRRGSGLARIGAALLGWGTASLIADLPYIQRLWREMREEGREATHFGQSDVLT